MFFFRDTHGYCRQQNSRYFKKNSTVLNKSGTFFAPQTQKKVKSIKRWIAFGMQSKGKIYLDSGAEEAVELGVKAFLPVV